MYRTKDDVLQALIDGKTKDVNIHQRMSDYRKKKKLDLVVMFFTALEEYRMFHEEKEDK